MRLPAFAVYRVFVLGSMTAGAGFLAGCSHTTAIVKASATPPSIAADSSKLTELPGIPFYVKRGMCKRETVWAEPRYTLEVDMMVGDKPALTRKLIIPRSYILNPADHDQFSRVMLGLAALAAARQGGDLDPDPALNPGCPTVLSPNWEALGNAVKPMEKLVVCEETKKDNAPCVKVGDGEKEGILIRIANTAQVVSEVDYDHVYYLNTRSPWTGTASVDAHLQSDGTLGEGSVQVNDQTWSTILSTIGGLAQDFSSVEAARFGAAAAATTASMTTPATSLAELSESVKGLDAIFKSTFAGKTSCSAAPGWPLPQPGSQKEVLGKSAADPASKDKSATPEVKTADPSISYRFSLTPTVYLHDHVSKDLCIDSGVCKKGSRDADVPSKCIADPDGVTGGSFTITKAGESTAKDDSNSIKVSGTVDLPKPDGSAKKN